MARSPLIVCETTNRWAISLRWALAGSGLHVQETSSWANCRGELSRTESHLVAWEVRDGNEEDVFQGLVDLRWNFPRTAMIVLAEHALGATEWVLREAGALHIVQSRRNLLPVVRLAARFLDQAADPRPDFREDVWSRLPWQDGLRE